MSQKNKYKLEGNLFLKEGEVIAEYDKEQDALLFDEDTPASVQRAAVQALSRIKTKSDNEEIAINGEDEVKSDLLTMSDSSFAEVQNIPSPPKINPGKGDKTPSYVRWLKEHRPEKFKKKYGVVNDGGLARRKTCLTEKVGQEVSNNDEDWNAE